MPPESTKNSTAVIPAEEVVRRWEVEDATVDGGSVLNRLCAECIRQFKSLVASDAARDRCAPRTMRSLEQSRSKLILWSDGHGLEEGNLDVVLSTSRFLRREVFTYLVSIATTISTGLVPALWDQQQQEMENAESLIREASTAIHMDYDDGDPYDSDSGSDSDESALSESIGLNEMAEDLETDTQCLMDLNALLRAPPPPTAASTKKQKAPAKVQWQPHDPYFSLISDRFPRANTELVERLAIANLERLKRCQADRESASRGAVEGEEDDDAVGTAIPAAGTVVYTEGKQSLQDSGIGTSIWTASAYAETVMTYRDGGRAVRVPPLTQEAKKGLPFDCVACGRTVRMPNNADWKRHLYADLRPWVCHDLVCQSGAEPFHSRDDWVKHLELEHGLGSSSEPLTCPLCREEIQPGRWSIALHLARHMEEIALAVLPTSSDADADASSEGSESIASLVSVLTPEIGSNAADGDGEAPSETQNIVNSSSEAHNSLLRGELSGDMVDGSTRASRGIGSPRPSNSPDSSVFRLRSLPDLVAAVGAGTETLGGTSTGGFTTENWRMDEVRSTGSRTPVDSGASEYLGFAVPPDFGRGRPTFTDERERRDMPRNQTYGERVGTAAPPTREYVEGSVPGVALTGFMFPDDPYACEDRQMSHRGAVLLPDGTDSPIPWSHPSEREDAVAADKQAPQRASGSKSPAEGKGQIYTRKRARQRTMRCPTCGLEFWADRNLRSHMDARHGVATKYKCRDPIAAGLESSVRPVVPLSTCKSCWSGKLYGAKCNVVAHLRRIHFFNPAGPRRWGSVGGQERGGVGGGIWPSMAVLEPWVEAIGTRGPGPSGTDDSRVDELGEDKLRDDGTPSAAAIHAESSRFDLPPPMERHLPSPYESPFLDLGMSPEEYVGDYAHGATVPHIAPGDLNYPSTLADDGGLERRTSLGLPPSLPADRSGPGSGRFKGRPWSSAPK